MNAANPNQETCPPIEELSAWHDGCGEPGLRRHIEACVVCQQTLATFERLDAAVRDGAQPSPDLVERIKTQCRGLPRHEPLLLVLWNRPLLRWAAAAAVVAAAVLMTHRQMNQATAAPDLAAAQPPPPPADVPLLVADGAPPPVPATTPGDAIGAGAPENGGTGTGVAGHAPVTSSRIMRVAADPAAAGATDTRQALLVPPRVRHVWVVNDVNAAKRTVLDSLPKDASVTVATSEDGTVAIQAVLPDRALQGLVDTLAEAGMSLLSPTAPQPNRAKNLIVTGRMVRYDMDLVHGP